MNQLSEIPPPAPAVNLTGHTALLKMQIGPVQEFIAQARSTLDLWSGSYLLSWLVAAGIRKLLESGGDLVFPSPAGQPLLSDPKSWRHLEDQTALLTPNFTNLFVARIPAGSAKAVAAAVELAITEEWGAICKSVLRRSQDFIEPRQEGRFKHQTERFLSISWQITPLSNAGYADAYLQNAWQLDAVRQTRDFKAWGTGATQSGDNFNKDSLSGKEEAIAGGPEFTQHLANLTPKPRYAFLFKHNDWLGAVALVKRVWHLAHLKQEYGLKTGTDEFVIRSTGAIAAKSAEADDDEDVETSPGEKYFAVLAFDGDQIGQWLSGAFLSPGQKAALEPHHRGFSAALSRYALKEVRPLVEKPGTKPDASPEEFGGFLVFAGGDDVLALLPAERALQCAQELRDAFQAATEGIIGQEQQTPDASVGIAIAHFKAPLQDVVRAAQAAERRAKQQLGRAAVAVSLFKRSGEITEWGCKWGDGGIELHDAIGAALDAGHLSAKFPHRVIELLSPYQLAPSGVTAKTGVFSDAAGFASQVDGLIRREFTHALSRQQGPAWTGQALADSFTNEQETGLLDFFLTQLAVKKPPGPECTAQEKLTRLTGLLIAVAFSHRTHLVKEESPPKGTPA